LSKTGESTLTAAATANAANLRLLADDVAYALFPRTGELPSEELQALVRLALRLIVSGVEGALGVADEGDIPRSWDMLCRSGLLREPSLIEYCLARIAEHRIRSRMDVDSLQRLDQLPALLLGDANPLIADTARSVLVADNRNGAFDKHALFAQLPPELLHLLAWRVVAVFKSGVNGVSDNADRSWEARCNALLAGRNDAALLQTSAAKLAYFLPEDFRGQLANPVKAGLPSFIAAIARRTGLSADLIYRLIDGDPVEPILVVLKACDFGKDDAFAVLHQLRGVRAEDRQSPHLAEDYAQLSTEDAARLCLSWISGNQGGVQ
jgi:hypothetical protein